MNRHQLLGLSLLFTLASANAFAQDVPSGIETSHLSTVFVTDSAGAKIQGKLLRLDGEGVLLVVDGAQKHYDFAQVRKVEKRGDSLKNGAIAGVVVGVVMGALASAFADDAASIAPMIVMSTVVYGSIGTCMDAMVVGRTTLYQQTVTYRMAPETGPRAAVKFNVSW